MKVGSINLIPQSRLLARRLWRRRRGWIIGLVLQTCLAVATCVAARQFWLPGSPATAAELNDARHRAAKITEQIAQLRRSFADLHAQQQANNAIVNQPDWSQLLCLLDQAVDADVVLRSLQLTRAPGGALSLNLSGLAKTQLSVSQFTAELQQSGVFASIKPLRIERGLVMDSPAIEFEIQTLIDEPNRGGK